MAPHAGRIQDVLERDLPADTEFTGDGAVKHAASLLEAGYQIAVEANAPAYALGLLRCVALGGAPELVDPAGWEPRYVRASAAERLWKV